MKTVPWKKTLLVAMVWLAKVLAFRLLSTHDLRRAYADGAREA